MLVSVRSCQNDNSNQRNGSFGISVRLSSGGSVGSVGKGVCCVLCVVCVWGWGGVLFCIFLFPLLLLLSHTHLNFRNGIKRIKDAREQFIV